MRNADPQYQDLVIARRQSLPYVLDDGRFLEPDQLIFEEFLNNKVKWDDEVDKKNVEPYKYKIDLQINGVKTNVQCRSPNRHL